MLSHPSGLELELPLIPHSIEGEIVTQRQKDGYVNATAMCTAAGKLFADYARLKATIAFTAEPLGAERAMEGQVNARTILLAGAVALTFALSAQTHAAPGPSFSCAAPEASKDALAQLECHDSQLAYAELRLVQSYYALRQQVGTAGWPTLKADYLAFDKRTRETCGVLPAGMAYDAMSTVPPSVVPCIVVAFADQRGAWAKKLIGAASEEVTRRPEDNVALQQRLKNIGFLPPTAIVDGVFGTTTRDAIVTWQRVNGLQPDGFLGSATEARLSGTPAVSAPTAIAPSASAPAANDVDTAWKQALSAARRKCASDWPDDYRMRAYCLDEQRKGFVKVFNQGGFEVPTPTTAASESTAPGVLGVSDLSRVVSVSQSNQPRFERDFKGQAFDGRVTFVSLQPVLFSRQLRFNAEGVEVVCHISKEDAARVIDWNPGRSTHLHGVLIETSLGSLLLNACEFS